jgi:hypothetical protein
MPTGEQIKECLNALMQTAKYRDKKTLMGGSQFTSLLADLNVVLESKDYETLDLGKDSDKKKVAKIIYTDFKTSLLESGGKIGPYTTNLLAETAVQAPQGNPTYTNLDTQYSANKPIYTTVRQEIVRFLVIRDAGHLYHDGNFSGSQTLRQIIDNVYATVQGGGEQQRVATNSEHYYHYNPMTKVRL